MKPYFLCGIVCLFVLLWQFMTYRQDSLLHVWILDVGQGDSILFQLPDKTLILVDGGPDSAVLSEMGRAIPPWVKTIDYVILTHPHADHYMGLFDVLVRFRVSHVILPLSCELDQGTSYLRELVEIDDGPAVVSTVRLISDIYISGGVRVSYINPGVLESGNVRISDNVNNCSLVVGITYGTFRVVLMGDAEIEEEEMLVKSISRKVFLNSDILKAGHHCSRTASGESFLRLVSPELVICSVGKDNEFGHPHSETVNLFSKLQIPYLRTDELGTIEIVSDGKTWSLD